MTTFQRTPLVLALALFIGACSSVPTTTTQLSQTRAAYASAQASPDIARYAQLELQQAGEALAQANAAAKDNDSLERINSLAYVARQKVALTQEVTKQRIAEAEVAQSGKQRDQMRLDQRTQEAAVAKANAQAAQANAQAATASAQASNANAAQAQLAAQTAQANAAQAQLKTQEAQNRAALLEVELKALAAKKTARGVVITLGDVLFGTDLARLTAEGMQSAQRLAKVLQENPERNVLVEGFTDSTGSEAHNQQLSERRANAVRTALLESGVAGERIAMRGYGESFPVAANDTQGNRQLNRRVEIVLSDESGKTIAR